MLKKLKKNVAGDKKSKAGFFCQDKRISFSTLHFDEIFKLQFDLLVHKEEEKLLKKFVKNVAVDKKKCLRNI